MKAINDLIEDERTHLVSPEQHGVGFNGFVTSWETVARYREYLEIVLRREGDAAAYFIKAVDALRNVAPSPIGSPSAELTVTLDDLNKSRHLVQLEIESFYLFANILLDSIARAMDRYFRPLKNPSLDSHVKLISRFEDQCRRRGIAIHSDFIDNAKILRKKISEFRNDQITHDERMNRITSIGVSTNGRVTLIATSTVIPQHLLKPQASSTHVGELIRLVDDYVRAVIEIVKTNRDRRILDYTN